MSMCFYNFGSYCQNIIKFLLTFPNNHVILISRSAIEVILILQVAVLQMTANKITPNMEYTFWFFSHHFHRQDSVGETI